MATRNQVLTLIAAKLKADAKDLIEYADEDTLGGFHIDPDQRKFPIGSIWGVEGEILYAIVRHLQPEIVAEIGGWLGASAAHIASALKANGKGHLYSIDNHSMGDGIKWELLPAELSEYVTLVQANGQDWLNEQADNSLGLVFEDAAHDTALVALLSSLALQKLGGGGVLVNHDAGHDQAIVGGGATVPSPVGRQVRDGLADAHAYFSVYRAEPSDCGLAITVKPNSGAGKSWAVVAGEKAEGLTEYTSTTEPNAELDPIVAINGVPVSNAHIESESTPPPPKKRATKKAK